MNIFGLLSLAATASSNFIHSIFSWEKANVDANTKANRKIIFFMGVFIQELNASWLDWVPSRNLNFLLVKTAEIRNTAPPTVTIIPAIDESAQKAR